MAMSYDGHLRKTVHLNKIVKLSNFCFSNIRVQLLIVRSMVLFQSTLIKFGF